MAGQALPDLQSNPRIRSCEIDGENYFNMIDVIAEIRGQSYQSAQTYYHVLKTRLKRNNVLGDIIKVTAVKVPARDGKSHFTDFATLESIDSLIKYLEPNLKKAHYRINVRHDDEEINFHPQIVAFFEANGWHSEHHYQLILGGEIDIIATSNDPAKPGMFIVECKPRLSRSQFYTALGQLLCYRAELAPDAIPVIATYASQINPYAGACCRSLGVKLIAGNCLENVVIQSDGAGGYDLVTEKPLLPKKASS